MQSGSGSSGMVASPVAIHSSKEIFGLRRVRLFHCR